MGLKNAQADDVPGTIYILDQEEIRLSGARDIMELLHQIPGISFGQDVDDVNGISIRGLWAHEGKYIIQLNGITLNETDFGTYAFNSRLPMDNVSRVEIMMGPGTVIFGGTAALGIINVVTFDAGENDGTNINTQFSGGKDGLARSKFGLEGNHYLGNQTSISYHFNHLEGSKSFGTEQIDDSTSIFNGDSTKVVNTEMYLKLQRNNFNIQFYRNDYSFDIKDADYKVNMIQNQFDAQIDKKIGSKNDINIRGTYGYFVPWAYMNTTDVRRISSNTSGRRASLSATLHSQILRKLNSNIGIKAYYNSNSHDWAESISDSTFEYTLNNLYGAAIFSDLQLKTRVGFFGISARGEVNSYVTPEFAPRAYYTFKKKLFYTKATYSYCYRIPTIENINLGPTDENLQTEKGKTIDLCLGLRNRSNDWLQISAYKTILNNPIIYVFDNENLDNYINRGAVASQGIDLMGGIKRKKYFLRMGFSYYENISEKSVLEEVASPIAKTFLAIPRTKGTLLAGYHFTAWLSWSATLIYQSDIYAYEPDESSEAGITLKNYAAVPRINSFVHINPVESPFSLRLGATNILNVEYRIASPYNNGISSMLMDPLQFRLDLNYRFTR